MNRYSAYPHRIPGGFGCWAMIRLCRDARPAPIMDAEDRPKVFQTKGEASEECLRHVLAYMNGKPIRGEVFEDGPYTKRQLARQTAQDLFHQASENAIKTNALDAANTAGRSNQANLIGCRNG